MIQINLLPGASRRGRGAGGPNLAAISSEIAARIKDPFLIGAIASVLIAVLAVGGLYGWQTARERSLTADVEKAALDSSRYARVMNAKRAAEAQRDSVLRQLTLIRSIDNNRFIWPHIMDEVSRALPPYTWLTSLTQTSPMTAPAAATPVKPGGNQPAPPPSDPTAIPVDTLRFRIVGNTVDIQALTRFMRLLESSEFIQNVQLANSAIIIEANKEITQFQLHAEYEVPDPSSIRTVPVTVSVR